MSQTLAALQSALAAEHAAVWGYGVLGAALSGGELRSAGEADTGHRDRRDQLAGIISDRGAVPVAPRPAYALPFAVRTVDDARQCAVLLEQRTGAAWYYLVGAADTRELRQAAVAGLTDTALWATRWRALVTPTAATVPFPGQ